MMKLIFQKQDIMFWKHFWRKKVNRLIITIDYHALLIVELFQHWLFDTFTLKNLSVKRSFKDWTLKLILWKLAAKGFGSFS